jgi:hypothetical protein
VQLQVAGEHHMLIEGLRPMSKSKLVSAFHSPAQSMPYYMWCRTAISHKAAIKVLGLGEFLRCALL